MTSSTSKNMQLSMQPSPLRFKADKAGICHWSFWDLGVLNQLEVVIGQGPVEEGISGRKTGEDPTIRRSDHNGALKLFSAS